MTKVTRPRSRVRASNTASVSVVEEDGTQVERVEKAAGTKTRAARSIMRGPDSSKFNEALKTFCNRILDEKGSVKKILSEHTTIKAETQSAANKQKAAFEAHPEKNRYKDVTCIDPTRVVLTFPAGGDDYIHANWVKGIDGQNRFICTQGPKDNSVEDLWRMIWQEKCKSVIMLCNVMECGKKKCEQYWPVDDKQKLTYPCGLTVKLLKAGELEKQLLLNKLEVSDGDQKLQVDHIQWKDWPDRGVPEATLMSMRLIQRIRGLLPSVVHCSAGIGRTGTIVGLDILHSRMEKGESPTMAEVMRELRDQRHGSIQTDVQYLFMHRIMLLLAAESKKVIPNDDRYKQWVSDYDAAVKTKS